MAGPAKSMLAAVMATVVVAAVMSPAVEASVPNCNAVVGYLSSCFAYVTGRGPIGSCCGGVNGLYRAASTTSDRQRVCYCLKGIANSIGGSNSDVFTKAAGLPKQCGVSIHYQISTKTDCSKVQ